MWRKVFILGKFSNELLLLGHFFFSPVKFLFYVMEKAGLATWGLSWELRTDACFVYVMTRRHKTTTFTYESSYEFELSNFQYKFSITMVDNFLCV